MDPGKDGNVGITERPFGEAAEKREQEEAEAPGSPWETSENSGVWGQKRPKKFPLAKFRDLMGKSRLPRPGKGGKHREKASDGDWDGSIGKEVLPFQGSRRSGGHGASQKSRKNGIFGGVELLHPRKTKAKTGK